MFLNLLDEQKSVPPGVTSLFLFFFNQSSSTVQAENLVYLWVRKTLLIGAHKKK